MFSTYSNKNHSFLDFSLKFLIKDYFSYRSLLFLFKYELYQINKAYFNQEDVTESNRVKYSNPEKIYSVY